MRSGEHFRGDTIQKRTYGFYESKGFNHLVSLFAYQSNGLPGLEIIGLGTVGRVMKEKFIYLSKVNGLSIPMKRYVLCVEVQSRISPSESQCLELPLLILFWSLAKFLPLSKTEDCFCAGSVLSDGTVVEKKFDPSKCPLEERRHWQDLKHLSQVSSETEIFIQLEDLFSNIQGIKVA